jgi:hypothetical protein
MNVHNDEVCHYTKLSTAIEYILKDNVLQFSSLKNTNDPYEYKKRILQFSWNNQSIVADENKRIRINNRFNEIILNRTKVICFCNGKNEPAYDKPRMWAQYGDNHRGVCFVFSKDVLNDAMGIEYPGKKYFFEDIFYSKILDHKRWKYRFVNEDCDGKEEEYIQKNYREIFFNKDEDYRDESETRLLFIDSDESVKRLNTCNALKYIIVGDNCPKEYFPIFKNYEQKFNKKVRRINYNHGEPVTEPVC